MATNERLAGRTARRRVAEDSPESIAADILRVHHESYGTGAHDVQVHLSDDLIVIVIEVELSAAERTLMQAGRGDGVKAMREAFQDAIAPTFAAVVERATGRRVISFISSLSLEPLYSVEFFRLGPRT